MITTPPQGIADLGRRISLSRHLYNARIERGLSVADVADRTGVTPTCVHLWEQGRTRSRDANLVAWCKDIEAARSGQRWRLRAGKGRSHASADTTEQIAATTAGALRTGGGSLYGGRLFPAHAGVSGMFPARMGMNERAALQGAARFRVPRAAIRQSLELCRL